ncbi:hypothetical protein [Sphingomonas soli]|uniref:hypothetical protein n=1 Tax=Sphingomonas soli TaxID=266127 RepID=UPI00083271BF|nr:hypothetical protein [Sphingomonas soli]
MPEMTKPQARSCAAFLKSLRRTGNVSMAAQEAGTHRQTLQRWRARFPDFASEWDAAIAFAEARLMEAGEVRADGEGAVTKGGEYCVRATRGRRIQVRRAKPGLLTPAGERTFLAHLAATANVRLSAAATGIGWNAIYARRRNAPGFAEQMDAALAEGYERLEMALVANAIASLDPAGRDGWRADAGEMPEPLERMSLDNALLLLSYRRPAIIEGRHHAHAGPRYATREETDAALTKALDAVERRMARDKARGATR